MVQYTWFHCMGTPVQATLQKNVEKRAVVEGHFQFLAGLGAVPVTILADLNFVPHLSLGVRSAIDVGCAQHLLQKRQPALLLRHAMCMQALGAELTWCLRNEKASARSVMLAWWATLAYPHISLLPQSSSLQSVNKPLQRL